LTSALDGGEWSAPRLCRFTPRERTPVTPLDRRLGGIQSLSGRGGEEKISHLLTELEPPIIQLAAQRYITDLSRLQTFAYIKLIKYLKDKCLKKKIFNGSVVKYVKYFYFHPVLV
jgi:hypothetical protein